MWEIHHIHYFCDWFFVLFFILLHSIVDYISVKNQTKICDQHSTKHQIIISLLTFPCRVNLYIYIFFLIWFDFWLVKSFKKHLSLNAIMGSNHFSYPTIFLPFFGGTRDILKLTDSVFIWLPFISDSCSRCINAPY